MEVQKLQLWKMLRFLQHKIIYSNLKKQKMVDTMLKMSKLQADFSITMLTMGGKVATLELPKLLNITTKHGHSSFAQIQIFHILTNEINKIILYVHYINFI